MDGNLPPHSEGAIARIYCRVMERKPDQRRFRFERNPALMMELNHKDLPLGLGGQFRVPYRG